MENLYLVANPITNPLLPYNPSAGSSNVSFFSNLIQSLITLVFVGAVIIFLFMVLWGAIQWIMSGGDKGAVQAAQGKIQHAVIGLVVLLSSFAIISVIGFFFNLQPFTNFSVSISGLKLGP